MSFDRQYIDHSDNSFAATVCVLIMVGIPLLAVFMAAGGTPQFPTEQQVQLRFETAVREAKVAPSRDDTERVRYAVGLYTWAREHRFDRRCDDGFLSVDGTGLPCFVSGEFRVVHSTDGIGYYREHGREATKLNPFVTDESNYRFIDINALVSGAR